MRITIIAPGSRGDVQPYLALGDGLGKGGHTVRFVTHSNFEGLVSPYTVEFWPTQGDVQEIASSSEMRARLEKGNFLSIMRLMAKEAEKGAVEVMKVALEACRGMDMIITGIGGVFIGFAVAEKLSIPLLQAYYIPFTPTRAYPAFLMTGLPQWFGGILNPPSYWIARQVIWQGFRSINSRVRRDILDTPDSPFFGPFNSKCVQGMPILYAYSPDVIPPPPDWDADKIVTGYWFLNADDGWTPPLDLVDFIESGLPPVFIGFGSMSSSKPEETMELIKMALVESGQRGVVLSGWEGFQMSVIPDSIYMLESASFEWLFPKMAAVVHHGGAGTTSAGLKAGIPSIVTPFMGDQPYWGRVVSQLGVGPAPISKKKLTAETLAKAIQCALSDQVMNQKAAELGNKIQVEDGVSRAIEVIEGLDR